MMEKRDTNDFSLEKRLRAARPEAPPLPPDFPAKVMARIDQQGLRVRPAWQLALRGHLPAAAAMVLVIGGVLLADGAVYEIRMNGSLEMLYFGRRFLSAFLGALPWDLLVGVALTGALAAGMLRYAGGMRTALSWLLLAVYGVSAGGGTVLANSGLNEQVQNWVLRPGQHLPLMSDFFQHRARFRVHHPGFRMGRVEALEGNMASLVSPTGQTFRVTLPQGTRVAVGDHLRLRGSMRGEEFTPEEGQLCDPRRTRRYFHHMDGMMKGGMGPGHMRGGPMKGGHMNGMGGGMMSPAEPERP